MDHLNIDEILEYVTATKLNEETMNLISKVNGHVRKCQKCKQLVEEAQSIEDKMLTLVRQSVDTQSLRKQSENIQLEMEK